MDISSFSRSSIAVVFLLGACAEDIDTYAAELNPEPRVVDVGYSDIDTDTDTPIFVLTPTPGVEIAFYAWSDRSVGMLAKTESGGPDFLGADELKDRSVTELFWALSDPGTIVPSALVEYQDALALDAGDKPWREVVIEPQGWGLDIEFLRVHENCVNATFTSNHCLPASPYTHDVCVTDTNSNWIWTTSATRNYKAGFCLDSGTVNDYLWYDIQAGDCNWFRSPTYIWGNPWGSGDQWNANTYLWWVWAAGSTSPSRQWRHKSYNGGGSDNYDWAIRQKPGTICSG